MKKFLLRTIAIAIPFFTGVSQINAQCNPGFTWTQTSANVISFTDATTGSCGSTPIYQWDFGDGGYSYTQSPTHTYNIPGIYNVCLTVADTLNVMFGTTWCTTDTVTGSVICNLNTYINTSMHPTCATCADGELVATVTGGTYPYYSILWNTGANTQTLSNLLPGFYSITVTDTNNCTATDTITLDTVGPPPSCNSSFTWSQTTANVIDFSASTSAFQPMYNWNFGDNTGGYGSNPSHTYLYTGMYTVCLGVWDSLSGCSSSFCDTISVTGTNAACVPYFTSYSDSLHPDTVFVYNQTQGVAPIQYTWHWGDNTSSTGAYPIHTYAASGTYTICLVIQDNAGCIDSFCVSQTVLRLAAHTSSNPVTVIVLGNAPAAIQPIEHITDISLYPNPAADELNLKSAVSVIGKQFEILNVTGQVVLNGKLTSSRINISALPSGVYFIRIPNEQGVQSTMKFMKN